MASAKQLLALAILAMCSAAVMAAGGPADGYFADWLAAASSAGKATTTKVSTASVRGYGEAEHKHVCLEETKLRDCRYVGCPSVQAVSYGACPNTHGPFASNPCYDCITHISGVSDLSCCHDSGTTIHDSSFLSAGAGTCDWDVDLFATIEPVTGQGKWFSPVAQGAPDTYKIGTAWGTCTLGSSAELCGSPLCDRLTISFQGGIYLTAANSRAPNSTDDSNDAEPYCSTLFGRYFSALEGDLPGPAGSRTGSRGASGVLPRLLKATGLDVKLASLTQGLSGAKKEAGAKGAKGAAASSYGDGDIDVVIENDSFYQGYAVTLMGPFSVVSMTHATEYEKGILEYTPVFHNYDGIVSARNANWPVVRPNAIKFNFVRSPEDSYYEEEGKEYYEEEGRRK